VRMPDSYFGCCGKTTFRKFGLSGQVKTGHTWSLQNRPYGPGLRCCTLPFAFLTSLISEISKWRAISSSKLEKISFTGPWLHFLEVSYSSGRGFLATFRRGALLFRRQLGSPAPRPAFEDMAVVEKAVEHSGDGRAVAEQFSPVLDRSVRRHQCARAFVTAHDDL
jgi:hypothetical protein